MYLYVTGIKSTANRGIFCRLFIIENFINEAIKKTLYIREFFIMVGDTRLELVTP